MRKQFQVTNWKPSVNTVFPTEHGDNQLCDFCGFYAMRLYYLDVTLTAVHCRVDIVGTFKLCESCHRKTRTSERMQLVVQRKYSDEELDALALALGSRIKRVGSLELANRILTQANRNLNAELTAQRVLFWIMVGLMLLSVFNRVLFRLL